MSIEKLDANLKKVTDEFINEANTLLKKGSDVDELGRIVYYALDDFRKEIISYLKDT